MRAPALDRDHREAAWERLASEQLDVLVVGGGVTGAGAALDAVTRGLSTALVEQRDLASGTSSRSSKLFHGGLRYLEQMNFDLVREALRERELMVSRLAPHLVRPVSFLYPLTSRGWERPYVTAGLTLYDTIGGARSMPRHRQLSRSGALKLAPGLKREALTGGLLYYDAQADDARHTLMTARTAASYGASVLTSARVVELLQEGRRVVGALVEDVETGQRVPVRASVVISCAGVWTDDIQEMSGSRGSFAVRASKGIHVVVPRDRIESETGLILRTEKSVLFVIPWGTSWIIGTTDTDWPYDRAHPAATRADIDYLLDHVNEVLRIPLTHEDIHGVYAGLRPLLSADGDRDPASLSREHAVSTPAPGLVTIAGGKYTTYRVMAADVVDAAREELGRDVPDSVTDLVPLSGAEGYVALVNQAERLARQEGLPAWRITHLLDRYGSLVGELFALAAQDRSLYDPLPGAESYLRVEVLYGATHEGALHLDDLLARRTRISIETPSRGLESARAAAAIVAPVLGWDANRVEAEVEAYRRRVEAEIESQDEVTDSEANEERVAAPDPRRIPLSRDAQPAEEAADGP